jgi:hypothetical protein
MIIPYNKEPMKIPYNKQMYTNHSKENPKEVNKPPQVRAILPKKRSHHFRSAPNRTIHNSHIATFRELFKLCSLFPEVYASQETVAAKIGIHVDTVQKATTVLSDLDYIKKTTRKGRQTCIYTLGRLAFAFFKELTGFDALKSHWNFQTGQYKVINYFNNNPLYSEPKNTRVFRAKAPLPIKIRYPDDEFHKRASQEAKYLMFLNEHDMMKLNAFKAEAIFVATLALRKYMNKPKKGGVTRKLARYFFVTMVNISKRDNFKIEWKYYYAAKKGTMYDGMPCNLFSSF